MLSDDEIWTLWNSQGSDEMNQKEASSFARNIEAAVLAKLRAQSEPVAWRFIDDEDGGHISYSTSAPRPEHIEYLKKWNRPAWEPLFAAPVQQESYWEGEARRYAGNADFWRDKCKTLEAQNAKMLEALKVADKALRWVETTAASRAWDIVRAAIAAVEVLHD